MKIWKTPIRHDAARNLPPLLSIVIPARNEQGYLRSTISALREGLSDSGLRFEIIVVEGGSTDATVDEATEADLLLIEEVTRRGTIATARNRGAAVAQGEILMHTDADIRIRSPALFALAVIHFFSDHGVVAVTGRVEPLFDEARPIDLRMHRIGNLLIKLSHSCRVYLARGEFQLVRASTFRAAGGYDESIALGEDWDLFRRLTRRGRVLYVDLIVLEHSVRRFRSIGYARIIAIYLREFASIIVLRRPHLEEWRPVR